MSIILNSSNNSAPGIGVGYIFSPLISDSETGGFSTLLSDGKILLVGTGTGYGCSVRRFNADASLDTTFGIDGVATQANNTTYWSWFTEITGIIVQPDGKILLTGDVLVRFNQDGSQDLSFGASGTLNVLTMAAQSAVVQSDGNIIVAGTDNTGSDFALTRYDSAGVLDTSFGTAGTVITNVSPGNSFTDKGQRIILQGDSKILVAGYTASTLSRTGFDFSLVRYNSNGSLDTSFSDDGKLTTSIASGSTGNDYAHSVLAQADNKILLAGESYNGSNFDLAITRYNTDGTIDTSFGIAGIVKTAIGPSNDYGYQLAKQIDHKILLSGWFNKGNNFYSIFLVRYNQDGSLDTTFGGGDGVVTQDLREVEDKSYSVLVQDDGKIVISGTSWRSTNKYDLFLLRYLSDGSIDYSYSNENLPSNRYTENQTAVTLNPSVGVYDAELFALNNYDGATLILKRQGNGNVHDLFSGAAIIEGQSSGDISITGNTIGSYSWTSGVLTISFNSNATASLVNSALKALAYRNSSDAPPTSVQIDWILDDGNNGSQGVGGALSVTKTQTVTIVPVNDLPSGSVVITGDALFGQVLTATNTISDLDGIGSIHYQWMANEIAIVGADADTFILGKEQVGTAVSVVALYTDQMGTPESMASASTSPVVNINDAPTGSVFITGLDNRGQILTASNNLSDSDGLGVIFYQWKADGVSISGANESTLTLGGAQVGKSITVNASYVDLLGTSESLNSAATLSVSNNAFPTFYASNGSTVVTVTSWTGELSSALQSDGRILVAGNSGGNFAIARFFSNGYLDTSFGVAGVQTVNLGYTDTAYSIAVQGTAILVGGSSNNNFALARLTSNGTLDTSFGNSGTKIIDFGSTDEAYSLTIKSDGKIVVAGKSGGNFAVAQLSSTGVLDTSFSDDGLQTFLVSGNSNSAKDVAIQSDGKIVTVGTCYVSATQSYDFAIARLNTLGNLDNTFSADGKDNQNSSRYGSDRAYAVAIQADGKILVGGGFSGQPTIFRYNPDGSLDTNFNGSGQLRLGNGIMKNDLRDIEICSDGKILITGSSGFSYSNSSSFVVARLNTNGTLDTSFSDDGYSTITATANGGAGNLGYASLVTAEAKVVVVGTVTSSGYYLGVAQFNADGTPDQSFAAPNTLIVNPAYIEGAVPITMAGSAKIYDENLTRTNYGGTSLILGRHGGFNADDHFTVYGYLDDDSHINISGQDVGVFGSDLDGSANISFNSYATEALVNSVLSNIQYSNSSDAPPASVLIDWTFSDGNSGAQGVGGALTTTGAITVSITPTNDSPVITSDSSVSALENTGGISLITLAGYDPDGESVTWEVFNADGSTLSDNFSFNAATRIISLVTPLDYETQSTYQLLISAHDASYADTTSAGFGVATYQTLNISVENDNDAPTFGTGDGISLFSGPVRIYGGSAWATDIALDAKNTIFLSGVTTGFSPASVFVASYNADGTLNTSFSSDGITTSELTSRVGDRQASRADGVAIQSDGKIIIAGGTSGDYWSSVRPVALARYNVDGSLDSSFSSDGWATATLGSGTSAAWDVAIQIDGKIILAGESSNGTNQDFSLFRFNTDGSLDTSFSYDGKASYDFFSKNEIGKSIALQSDRKILVAGYNYGSGSAEIIRFDADGNLDTMFSGDGYVSDSISPGSVDFLYSIAVQADGKILAAGSSALSNNGVSVFALFRYNANGTLDATFSEDGKQTTDFGLGGSQGGQKILIQQDEKIVLVGTANSHLAIARYNMDGGLDSSFAQSGKFILKIDGENTQGSSAVLQADGKILVTGSFYASGSAASDSFVLRLNSDGTLDPSFDSNHILNGVPWFYQGGSSVLLDADVLVSDDDLNRLGYQNSSVTLFRHGGANVEDSFSNGQGLSQLTEASSVVALGVNVGSVLVNRGGTLTLVFNADATQSLVNTVLQNISYSTRNVSHASEQNIQIDWLFSDGNEGSQGSGGVKSSTGSVSVHFVPDTIAPTLASSDPADNASSLHPSGNLSLTFSEAVFAGSGNILITDLGNASDNRTIAITDATQVSFAGSVLTINPTANLLPGAHYAITMNSGVIVDNANNPYAGTTSYNFTTTVPLATYSLVASPSTVNEDGAITFTVATTSVAANTVLNYMLFGIGITTTDIGGAALSGTATVDSTGHATFTVNLAADHLTEGTETLTATVEGQSASVTINDTSANPIVVGRTKYFVLPSSTGANFTDFNLSYGLVSLTGEQVNFVGSTAVDAVFVRPGVTVDFTLSGSGADKIYLGGSFASYTASITGSVMNLQRGSGATLESVSFIKSTSAAASDSVIFADGTLNSLDLYNNLKTATPLPALSTTETSIAPLAPAAADSVLSASIKAFALNAAGDTFAPALPGVAMTLVGSVGVDTVYVPRGGVVDCTLLGSAQDAIYFTGNWGDYTKAIAGSVVSFSRSVDGYSESVRVVGNPANVSLNDLLIFADGAVHSGNAKTALTSSLTTALSAVTGYDPTMITPGLAPVFNDSALNGVSNLEAGSNLVLHYRESVTAMSGKYIHIVNDGGTGFHGESATHTLDILVTDTTQVSIVGGRVSLNPTADLDLSNNYHITIDAGAFTGGDSHLASAAYDGTSTLHFSTVTPGTSALANAAASQVMNVDGTLDSGHLWLDIEGIGSPSPGVGTALDLAANHYALVAKDYNAAGGAPGNDGVTTGAFYVAASNFGAGDLIYIDNQGGAANDLSQTYIGNDGSPPAKVQFGETGLGGMVDISLAATVATFDTIAQMKALLGSSTSPVISA
jgi:uncharacterized delta-60 repeat protein